MRFSIITLGCKVNAYESQFYAKQLKEAGWEEDNETFDVVLINSCAVTNTAASKSRQMLHKAKRNNPNAYSVLIGCYAQVLSEEEKKAFDVDLIMAPNIKKKSLISCSNICDRIKKTIFLKISQNRLRLNRCRSINSKASIARF